VEYDIRINWLAFPLHPEIPDEGMNLEDLFTGRRVSDMRAEEQGKGDEYHLSVFKAYFVEGINIGRAEELFTIAASLGLSPDHARRVLEERIFRHAVDGDWARSRSLDITGVPTFLMNGARVVGAQPFEVLEEFVKESGDVKRRFR
jgi:predicted DsbA family dithiol-disulfide isomerase